MFVIIIFGFLLLIGLALLASLLGTAFLRRHVVKPAMRKYAAQPVERPAPIRPPVQAPSRKGRDLGEEYEAGYEEGIGEQGMAAGPGGIRGPEIVAGAGVAPGGRGVARQAAPRMPATLPERVSTTGGGKWAFIVPVVVIAIILVLFFGLREFQGFDVRPRLYFCESVNFTKLKPVNRSDTFTRGNVTLFVKSKTPLFLDSARVEIYKMNIGGFEPYAERELKLKPEWTAFTVKVLFDTVGSYMVSVFGSDEVLIVQKNINIVPDSFAYKPVK